MIDRFEILDTPIHGLKLIRRNPLGDRRGYLERFFCTDELQALLPSDKGIAQINLTLTENQGTIRGMHFQHPPHAESKFVSCLRGEVFDVAVDLRRDSPTFLHWHAEILTPDNHRTLLIPEGFAHGFQTLADNTEMLYFHTEVYRPAAEDGLNPRDPRLDIEWPIAIAELSERDKAHSLLDGDFAGVDA